MPVRRQASPQVRSLHKDSINTFLIQLDTHICSWFESFSSLTPQNLSTDGLYHVEARYLCLSVSYAQKGCGNKGSYERTCRDIGWNMQGRCQMYNSQYFPFYLSQGCSNVWFCVVSRILKRLLSTVQILILGVTFKHDDHGCRVRWVITLLNRLTDNFCRILWKKRRKKHQSSTRKGLICWGMGTTKSPERSSGQNAALAV